MKPQNKFYLGMLATLLLVGIVSADSSVTASNATKSIVGALALGGIMLIGCGSLILINMFRGVGGGMGRGGGDQSQGASLATMGLGVTAIGVGSILLLICYMALSPLIAVAGG
jgi:hypothetical protein